MSSTSFCATRWGAWHALLVLIAVTDSACGERIVASDLVETLPEVPCVDVNGALYHDLTRVQGLGNGLAKTIVAARSCPYKDVGDFESRLGSHAHGSSRWGVLKQLLDSGSLCVGKPKDSECLEVNGASKWDFVKVEGIDEDLARAIVLSRTCPYLDEADMQKKVEVQKNGQVFWMLIKKLIDEKKLCKPAGGAGPTGIVTTDLPTKDDGPAEAGHHEQMVTYSAPSAPNKDDGPAEAGHHEQMATLSVANKDDGPADVGRHQQMATLSAAELGEEVDGSVIKVTGLPEVWNAKDEGSLGWTEARSELVLRLKHKSSEDSSVVSHMFFFDGNGLEFVDGTFTWTCRHWPYLVLTGRLADGGAKKVADVAGEVLKRQ